MVLAAVEVDSEADAAAAEDSVVVAAEVAATAAAVTGVESRPTSKDVPATGNVHLMTAATQTLPGATSATSAEHPSLRAPAEKVVASAEEAAAVEALAEDAAVAAAAALETGVAVEVASAAAAVAVVDTEAVVLCGVAAVAAETDTALTRKNRTPIMTITHLNSPQPQPSNDRRDQTVFQNSTSSLPSPRAYNPHLKLQNSSSTTLAEETTNHNVSKVLVQMIMITV